MQAEIDRCGNQYKVKKIRLTECIQELIALIHAGLIGSSLGAINKEKETLRTIINNLKE